MSDASGNRIWRVLGVVVLAIATLGFGAVGLCGAAFTVMSLPDMFSGGPENYAGVALVIAVRSLLIGGPIAWWCGRLLWRLVRTKPGVNKG